MRKAYRIQTTNPITSGEPDKEMTGVYITENGPIPADKIALFPDNMFVPDNGRDEPGGPTPFAQCGHYCVSQAVKDAISPLVAAESVLKPITMHRKGQQHQYYIWIPFWGIEPILDKSDITQGFVRNTQQRWWTPDPDGKLTFRSADIAAHHIWDETQRDRYCSEELRLAILGVPNVNIKFIEQIVE
jgi:hypothetical protein